MLTNWAEYGVPEILSNKPYDLYEDKHKIFETLLEFLSPQNSRWCLYLYGEPGCGKTHFACNALKAFIIKNRNKSARFFTSKSYFKYLQEAFNDPIEAGNRDQKLRDCDLVILDDFGTSRGTDWQREKLYDLLEERYDSGKKTIVSSNLSLKETTEGKTPLCDDRLYRRLTAGLVVKMLRSKDHGKKNSLYKENI